VALLGEGDHVLDVAVDAHVGADEAPLAAALGDGSQRRLTRDIRDVGDDDRGPLVDQPQHDRPTGTRRAAGHDGDPAAELHRSAS
jgi:hypothetical protein